MALLPQVKSSGVKIISHSFIRGDIMEHNNFSSVGVSNIYVESNTSTSICMLNVKDLYSSKNADNIEIQPGTP